MHLARQARSRHTADKAALRGVSRARVSRDNHDRSMRQTGPPCAGFRHHRPSFHAWLQFFPDMRVGFFLQPKSTRGFGICPHGQTNASGQNPRISGKNCIAEGNRFHPAASKASQEDRRSAQPLRRRRRKIAGASKGGRPHMPPVRTTAPEICSLYGVQGGQGLPPVGRGSLRSYSFRSRNPFPILYKCAIL